MASTITLLYCPFPSLDTARTAATTLLNERHVACCNLIPQGESLYHWEGNLTTSHEVYVLCKTTAGLAEAAAARLATLHPYECPAIITSSAMANDAFAAWVNGQTQPIEKI